MKIKVLNGTHFEINKKISIYFKKYFNKANIKIIESEKVQKIINILESEHPVVLEELKGRAKGFDISVSEFISLTSYELSELNEDRCSDIYVCEKELKGIYHNEDGSDEIVPILCSYDDEAIFDLSCYSALHGTTFSATKNLMFSINYIYNKNLNLNADLPTWIFTRLLLSCKNFKEVKKTLKKYSIWGSVSINLLDVKTNKLFSIEKHNNINSIKEIKNTYFKTNTFIHKDMQKFCEVPKEINTSQTRFNKIAELLQTKSLTYQQIILYNNGNDYDSVKVTGQNRNNCKTQVTVFFCNDRIEIIKENETQIFLIKNIFSQ